MIVATYTVHDKEPRIMGHVSRPAKWLVRLFATDGSARITDTIRNRQPCMLSDLLQEATNQIDELIQELPAYTDAGFQVIRLR